MRPDPVSASETTPVPAPAATATPVGRLPMFHVIGFTGHRHLTNVEAAATAIREALELLRQEFAGEWVALSSIADGGDRLFVQQARTLGLSWHAILPLPRAEFAKDFTEAEWQDVETTLQAADHVRILEETGDRDESYLDCGIETVNDADVLLAVWDGDRARGKGGTADVVQYARSISKPLLIVDAVTHKVRRENWARLQREDPVLADLNSLPEAHSAYSTNPFAAPDAVHLFQQKCDYYASHGAPQYRRLIVSTVMAHVTATLISAAVTAYGLHLLALPWAEFLFVSFALSAALILNRHLHSHHSWVRCRLAAEFCRSALATWGLPRAAPLLQDLDLVGTQGLARALHILHLRSAAKDPVGLEEFKSIYLVQRIDDQLAYFQKQVRRSQPLLKRLKFGFWGTTILALCVDAFHAISRTFDLPLPDWVKATTFVFLSISLPVIAAAFILIISINDLQRRFSRFKDMVVLLESSRTQVTSCRTWPSVERVVLKMERALLHEVIEWHSTRAFSSGH
jgi:hypothetical protein